MTPEAWLLFHLIGDTWVKCCGTRLHADPMYKLSVYREGMDNTRSALMDLIRSHGLLTCDIPKDGNYSAINVVMTQRGLDIHLDHQARSALLT